MFLLFTVYTIYTFVKIIFMRFKLMFTMLKVSNYLHFYKHN